MGFGCFGRLKIAIPLLEHWKTLWSVHFATLGCDNENICALRCATAKCPSVAAETKDGPLIAKKCCPKRC